MKMKNMIYVFVILLVACLSALLYVSVDNDRRITSIFPRAADETQTILGDTLRDYRIVPCNSLKFNAGGVLNSFSDKDDIQIRLRRGKTDTDRWRIKLDHGKYIYELNGKTLIPNPLIPGRGPGRGPRPFKGFLKGSIYTITITDIKEPHIIWEGNIEVEQDLFSCTIDSIYRDIDGWLLLVMLGIVISGTWYLFLRLKPHKTACSADK